MHGDHAGYRDAALLSAGELQRGTLKKAFVHAGEMRRLVHAHINLGLGKLHILRAESDVLVDGLFKKLVLRILKHQANPPFDIAAGDLAAVDILPVQQHAAGGRLKQGIQVLDKGRLPRAGVAQQADALALSDAEADIVNADAFEGRAGAVYMLQIFCFQDSHQPLRSRRAAATASAHSSTCSRPFGR